MPVSGRAVTRSSEVTDLILEAGRDARAGASGVTFGWCDDAGFGEAVINRSITEAKRLGMSWVRYDARPTTGGTFAGIFNQAGLNQLVVLFRSWNTTDLDAYPETALQYALDHYENGARAFEIANEPNLSGMIDTDYEVAAEVYAGMVRDTYALLRQYCPDATIVAGALARNNSTGWNFEAFTELLYEAGIAGHFDAYSVHPYTATALPSTVSSLTADWHRVPLVRDVMVAYGDGDKKIWATEFSSPTADNTYAVTEAEAGAILKEALDLWGARAYSGPMFHYQLRDNQAGSSETFGIFNNDWSLKVPVWLEARNHVVVPVAEPAP